MICISVQLFCSPTITRPPLRTFARIFAGGVTAKVVQAVVDARVFEPRTAYELSLYSFNGFMRDAMAAYDQFVGNSGSTLLRGAGRQDGR
jgi:hypothetical protein